MALFPTFQQAAPFSLCTGPQNYVVGPGCIHVISGEQQKLSKVEEIHSVLYGLFSQLESNVVIFLAGSDPHHQA